MNLVTTFGNVKMLPIRFQSILLLAFVHFGYSEREHRVHNIVLFKDKYSWCKLTPIQQIITSPGYESATIDNNICVGACWSYSIPKTQPAEPGEIIGPYCDSCQPNVTKCYHITLKADSTNLQGPKTIQKQIEIIESCDCKACEENAKVDCELSEDSTLELPDRLYTNRDSKTTKSIPIDSSETDLLQLKPDIKTNAIPKSFEEETNNVEKKYDLSSKVLKLLKAIQSEPSNEILNYDKDELRSLLDLVGGPEKKLDDKNLVEFVNYVNSNNIDDFELDIQKLKEVLIKYQRSKDLKEKHRNFWLEFSDNAKIEEDLKKLHMPESYGIEGNTLGMRHHYTGSHIGMGIKPASDINANVPTLVTLNLEAAPTSNAQSSQQRSSDPIKHHHHYDMEEEKIDGRMEHLIKGPHGSLVLTPNAKIEEQFSSRTNDLKPRNKNDMILFENDVGDEVDATQSLDD